MTAYAVTASGFKTHWLDAIRQVEKACKALDALVVCGWQRKTAPSAGCVP